jgi:GNAT superfamily N-acetyltransferase
MTSTSHRPLSRRLAQHRDEILAQVNDPAIPFHRFTIVGDVGSGKSALLREVAEHCRGRGLLVLDVAAPRVTRVVGTQDRERERVELDACSALIDSFITCIDTFGRQHPRAKAATARAVEALKKTRNPQRLDHLVFNTNITVTDSSDTESIGNVTIGGEQALLPMLRGETESALLGLASECALAILIDDVHLLDRTSLQDWLRAILRRIPTRCTVTARHEGNGSWQQGQTDDDRTLELRNMDLGEVRDYLADRSVPLSEDEARSLFAWSGGQGVAVATFCDLALDGGGEFADLLERTQQAGGTGLARLVESVQLAVDEIPVEVLGYRLPLFALLTITHTVTPKLIAMLEGDTGVTASEPESWEIYGKLASRRFIFAIDDNVENGVQLSRAVSDVARQRLRDKDPVLFRRMHACAELYEREWVDLDFEAKDKTPFAAWTRFEQRTWIDGVVRWLDHAQWLDHEQFAKMKPALVKMYLDAFWWWDDYLRSAATRRLGPALRAVADQQRDVLWMNALEKFSDHWVSSWEEAELRADPGQWRQVLDAITALLAMFDLRRGRIPQDPALRRIYILLCNFYGKALWYAGDVEASHAREADKWLTAAALACITRHNEKEEDNPNGWIRSWALYRRADFWSALDPQRSWGHLNGLDVKAIADDDLDLRVGIAILTGDLRWRNGDFASAFDAYSRALLISYAYNVRQESRRQAPNYYTTALYASSIRRAELRSAELGQAGESAVLDTALANMRELFKPYWDRTRDREDSPSALPRSALPVPPPVNDEEFSLESGYVADMEHLAQAQRERIEEPSSRPLEFSRDSEETQMDDGMRIYEAPGSGPVIEDFYHQILQPSFPAAELIDLDELQDIADREDGSVWLIEDEDGTILGGAVAEWDESVRVVLLGYLAVRPGARGSGIGGPLYLAALESWRQRFKPCLALAEIEDPAAHSGSDDYGDPAARLRFYVRRGSKILDIPYFQPALAEDRERVSGLLLIVLHADPEFAGQEDGTIDPAVVRGYLENYQIQYEGKVATDDQAMEMWRAIDRPGGIRLRDE